MGIFRGQFHLFRNYVIGLHQFCVHKSSSLFIAQDREGLDKVELVPILFQERYCDQRQLPDEVSQVARQVWLVIY